MPGLDSPTSNSPGALFGGFYVTPEFSPSVSEFITVETTNKVDNCNSVLARWPALLLVLIAVDPPVSGRSTGEMHRTKQAVNFARSSALSLASPRLDLRVLLDPRADRPGVDVDQRGLRGLWADAVDRPDRRATSGGTGILRYFPPSHLGANPEHRPGGAVDDVRGGDLKTSPVRRLQRRARPKTIR